MRMHHRSGAHRAFTLLEMSIVLGIIALIAGAGMSMANGSIITANRILTQERLKTIKLALDSYAKTYGYLPCPGDRSMLPTNASFGVEQRTGASPATSCVANAPGIQSSGNAWYGAVPVRSLGLPDTYAGDAWGNKFTYSVGLNAIASAASNSPSLKVSYNNLYPQATQDTMTTFSAVANNGGLARLTTVNAPATGTVVTVVGGIYKGSYTITKISPTVIDLQGSTYSATDSGTYYFKDPAGVATTYVVVSHGKDGRGAFPMNATAVPTGKLCNTSATALSSPPPCTDSSMMTCLDITNCSDSSGLFVDADYNDGTIAALYFDDFIIWGSTPPLMTYMSTSTLYSACPSGAGNCEAWCAACSVNYPGGGATAPPAALATQATLFKKVLTSSSGTCTATCFWGGLSGSEAVKAP